MAASMTGYGRGEKICGGKNITVEIKAVNHRYFEFSSRIPRSYGYLEDRLKNFAQSGISRGKVDLYMSVTQLESAGARVNINHELARAYLGALRELAAQTGLRDDIALSSITRFSDIFTVERLTEDEEEIWREVREVAGMAMENFLQMRRAEGGRLAEDVLERLLQVETLVAQVETRAPRIAEEYRNRLYQRLQTVLVDRGVDAARVLPEAAIFAARPAVAEEIVRLKSHIGQFRVILSEEQPAGRKLDFLVQEINREVNTIGSKAQDIETGHIVVEMKSEIEKIREQIQNIE
jgi:uncharacterized protein (TIGR00255 family)